MPCGVASFYVRICGVKNRLRIVLDNQGTFTMFDGKEITAQYEGIVVRNNVLYLIDGSQSCSTADRRIGEVDHSDGCTFSRHSLLKK